MSSPHRRVRVLRLAPLLATAAAWAATPDHGVADLLRTHCVDCHGEAVQKADLNLAVLDPAHPERDPKIWEAVVRKLDHRQMPPLGESRPDEPAYRQAVATLAARLDQAAALKPAPGRTDSLRRLNRTEYQNAIRDLLALDIDAVALLPNDEPSLGFDNVTLGTLSPLLLDRYLSLVKVHRRR